MKNFYPNEEGQISDPDSMPISQLTVYTGSNGDIFFGCQWDTGPEAIQSIATIFYQLIHEDLLTDILKDLKDQCVLEDREQEFDMIISHSSGSYSKKSCPLSIWEYTIGSLICLTNSLSSLSNGHHTILPSGIYLSIGSTP